MIKPPIRQYAICEYYRVFPTEIDDKLNGNLFYYLGSIPNAPGLCLVVDLATGSIRELVEANLTEVEYSTFLRMSLVI